MPTTGFRERLASLDLLGPAGGVLGCSLLSCLFAVLAFAVRTPVRLHAFFLLGAAGQSGLAFISALQLLGLLRSRAASNVQDLHITR